MYATGEWHLVRQHNPCSNISPLLVVQVLQLEQDLRGAHSTTTQLKAQNAHLHALLKKEHAKCQKYRAALKVYEKV